MKKLAANRVDAVLINDIGIAPYLEQAGLSRKDVKLEFTVFSVDLYAILSLGTDVETVTLWQNAFEELQTEGFVQAHRNQWIPEVITRE